MTRASLALPVEQPSSGRVARLLAWSAKPLGATLVVAALIVAGAALAVIPGLHNLDLELLDFKFALLAKRAPIPALDTIAIVGVDEGSLAQLAEPQSLLLRPVAGAITAVTSAKPRAIGLDLILPDRSHDAFAPGSDLAMIGALVAARRVTPVVVGLTTHDDGRVRAVLPSLLAAAGRSGTTLLPLDDDGRVRRFDDRLGEQREAVPTLVGEIAAALSIPLDRGLIQYALGDGFDYIPLARVLAWHATGASTELERAFAGRIVLFGAVLPFEDRLAQPVPLARWDPQRPSPGVLVHAQALRTLEAGAMVRDVPWPVKGLLLALSAALWYVPTWHRRALALLLFSLAIFAASLLLLRQGLDLPVGMALRVAIAAAALKSALEAWQVRQERARLRAQFSGYVSPAVLEAILDGRLDEDARRGRRMLAFLFADIRGFVALSAGTPPEDVLALINRYFEAMTPVLHTHGGTIDNFRGDGVMAVFGAPNTLANPAAAASAAARAMIGRLAEFNRTLVAEGRRPLAIGVTLAWSEAVVGNVGSHDRFNYTALGDGANVAARLQDVAKSTGWPVIATAALVEEAGESVPWTPLGTFAIRGRGDVEVFGWRPAE